MPLKSFLETFSYGFLVGGAVYGLMFAAFWIEDKICDQDEQIEKLFSRLEDCEEKIDKAEESRIEKLILKI